MSFINDWFGRKAEKKQKGEYYVLDKNKATEFDYVILLDGSGSMSEPSERSGFEGQTRWTEQRELAMDLTRFVDSVDDNGLDVVLMNRGGVEVFHNVHADAIGKLLSERRPQGGTPMGEALAEAVKLHDDQGKNMIVLAFTDGAPNSTDRVVDVLRAKANKIDRDEQFTVCFVQIGQDPDATRFLKFLDDDLNAKFDIVDVIPAPEAEKMDPLQLLEKAIND